MMLKPYGIRYLRRAFARSFCMLIGIGFLPCLGCGSGRPTCIPVTGTVSYRGQPVEDAGVAFIPTQGRQASGKTNEQGRFILTTFSSGDGALLGEYVVCIAKTIPNSQGKADSPYSNETSVLPSCYAKPAQSSLRASVTVAGPNNFHFDLTD